jgi:hypothetical protein
MHDEKFFGHFTLIFSDFLDLTPHTFQSNDCLIDLGCGPRPALDWFHDGIKICIDPLLNKYRHVCKEMKLQWWEKRSNYILYSFPAEKRVASLIGKGKFILCWNILQHTLGWKKIIENICRYAREDSIVCISTEFGTRHIGHPANIPEEEFMQVVLKNFTVLKLERNFMEQDVTLKLRLRV